MSTEMAASFLFIGTCTNTYVDTCTIRVRTQIKYLVCVWYTQQQTLCVKINNKVILVYFMIIIIFYHLGFLKFQMGTSPNFEWVLYNVLIAHYLLKYLLAMQKLVCFRTSEQVMEWRGVFKFVIDKYKFNW